MTPRSKKLLIGCGIGCMSLVLLSVGSCVGFMIWIQRPGELLEPARLLGGNTTGYVEWTLRIEDPGTAAFVEGLVEMSQSVSRSGNSPLPPWMDNLLRNQQRRQNEDQIRMLFPVLAAWTLHPAETGDRDHHLFTISLEQAGNRMRFLDWILGWSLGRGSETDVDRYGGETVFSLRRTEFCFFVRGNDLFLASDLTTAHQALDRLNGAVATVSTAGELDRWLSRVPEDAPLRGALVNEHGELERVLGVLTGGQLGGDVYRELAEEVETASVTGGFTGPSAFELQLDLWPGDEGWPRRYSDSLGRALQQAFDDADLVVGATAVALADRLRVTLRIEDVPAFVEAFFD